MTAPSKKSNLARLTTRAFSRHRQFLLYCLIGLSGVTIDVVLFALGTKVLGIGVLLANFLAISIAIVNNFILNAKFNFKVQDRLVGRFLSFYAVGFLGIALSQVLIYLFHYVGGLEEVAAKALTLPPVLFFQYFLNKSYSFGDYELTKRRIKKLFFHLPFLVLLALYVMSSLVIVRAIPSDFSQRSLRGAPDESVHYNFNVKFIKDNWRLPVSGKDDLKAYQSCRDNPSAQVTCTYSYNVFPAPGYIIGAVSAYLLSDVAGLFSPSMAARTVSFVSGIIFVIFSYAMALAITRSRFWATLIAALTALIPQVIFTNSYLNLDAYSLAISAIAGYALVRFMQEPKSIKTQAFCAIAVFGLLPIAKYNFFPLIPAATAMIIWTMYHWRVSKVHIKRFALLAVASFIALAAFWYVRNYILYQDILGQGFVLSKMAEMHWLGEARPLNFEGFQWLIHLRFFDILFNSFFYGFGGMFYFLEESHYAVIKAIVIAAATFSLYLILQPTEGKKVDKALALAFAGFLSLVAVTLYLIIYNSLTYDFQPQGRYMFPILVPATLFLSYAITRDRRFGAIIFLLLAGLAFIFWKSLLNFIVSYFPL